MLISGKTSGLPDRGYSPAANLCMTTSCHGSAFGIIALLWRESHRRPIIRSSYLLTLSWRGCWTNSRELLVIWDAMVIMWVTSLKWRNLSSQITLKHCLIYHDISYNTTIKKVNHRLDLQLTIRTHCLALNGKLWGVYFKCFGGYRLWWCLQALFRARQTSLLIQCI